MYEFQEYSSLYIYNNNDATYPAHFHTHCEIMYVLDGEVDVMVDGVTYKAIRDEAIFIAPHQIHSFKSSHMISIFILFIELATFNDYAERMAESLPASPIVHLELPEEVETVRAVLHYLWDLFQSPHAHVSQRPRLKPERVLTARSMVKAAIAIFMDHIEWSKKQSVTPDIMRQILEYCAEHYKTDISIQSIADALDVSPHAVTRIFTANFHQNFRKYINSLRIDEAAHKLISSADSITQIAFSVGFDTLRTFNRAFLAERNVTPSEYRRMFSPGEFTENEIQELVQAEKAEKADAEYDTEDDTQEEMKEKTEDIGEEKSKNS